MKKLALLALLVSIGIGILLITIYTPIIKAQNIQVNDIFLTTYVQSANVGELISLKLESTNEEDTKVFIPLTANVQYQGGNGGSGALQYDEVNHQIIVDWPSEETRSTNFDLFVTAEGDFSTKAYSIREDSAVESAPIYIQTNSNETEESLEDPTDEVIDSSVSEESQMPEPSTEHEESTTEESIEISIDETIDIEKSEVETVEEETLPQVTGTWGDVPWEWDDSTATITLQGGNAGTVATAPWKTYTEVQRIIAEETVVLQANASSLFASLRSLTYLEVSSFDTSQVTNLSFLFQGCSSLEVLNLNGWDTSRVGTINRTFHDMPSLIELDISSWDMMSAWDSSVNSWFIYGASNLRTIHLGEKTTFLSLSSSSRPVFIASAPSEEYTGNWIYLKDQNGNPIEERVATTRTNLLHTFYDGSKPGTYTLEKWRTIEINPIDNNGNLVGAKQTLRGGYFEDYEIIPPSILGWSFDLSDKDLTGRFSTEQSEVNLVYRLNDATVLDPLNPEEEINPEQMPELAEELESFRIDYVPALSFGTQKISNKKEEYYAESLKVDGSIEDRPNFVQISNFDRSTTSWILSVRQESQFHTDDGEELMGAYLSFINAELVSVHDQRTPSEYLDEFELIPGKSSQLIKANTGEGVGTWIYRFGNTESKDNSVKLTVPGNATPSAKEYTTKLTWTISAVP